MRKKRYEIKRFYFPILLILLMIILLSSCGEVPEQDEFTVSKLVDLKISNYKAIQYEFHNVSDYLSNDSLEGNMIIVTYNSKGNTHAKIVSAHTTKLKGVYYLWRDFAKENNALFKSSFTAVPFVMGEYKIENDNLFVDSWFKDKWFFYIESETPEGLESIRTQVIEYFKNPDVINESVIDL